MLVDHDRQELIFENTFSEKEALSLGFVKKTFSKGEKHQLSEILNQRDVWFVEGGEMSIDMEIVDGRSIKVLVLRANEWGIPLCCISQNLKKDYIFRANFNRNTDIYILSKKESKDKSEDNIGQYYAFCAQSIGKIISSLADAAFLSIKNRLYKSLKEHSNNIQSMNIYLTHSELAEELGTSREVISRTMKKLEKEGIIRQSRGKIRLIKGKVVDDYE